MKSLLVIFFVLSGVSTGWSTPSAREWADVFGKICADGSSNWIAAGEKIAKERNWTASQNEWGRKFGVKISEGNEPPIFDVRSWILGGQHSKDGKLSIWMVGPEWPQFKVNSCAFDISGKIADDLIKEIASRQGYSLEDLIAKPSGVRGWSLENNLSGTVGRAHSIMVTEKQIKDDWHSFILVLKYDLPADRKGFPIHQSPFP